MRGVLKTFPRNCMNGKAKATMYRFVRVAVNLRCWVEVGPGPGPLSPVTFLPSPVQGCVCDVSKSDSRQALILAVTAAFGGQLNCLGTTNELRDDTTSSRLHSWYMIGIHACWEERGTERFSLFMFSNSTFSYTDLKVVSVKSVNRRSCQLRTGYLQACLDFSCAKHTTVCLNFPPSFLQLPCIPLHATELYIPLKIRSAKLHCLLHGVHLIVVLKLATRLRANTTTLTTPVTSLLLFTCLQ